VHTIYAEQDVPQEFTRDIELNATQAEQVKESVLGRSQPARSRCLEPWSGKTPWAIE